MKDLLVLKEQCKELNLNPDFLFYEERDTKSGEYFTLDGKNIIILYCKGYWYGNMFLSNEFAEAFENLIKLSGSKWVKFQTLQTILIKRFSHTNFFLRPTNDYFYKFPELQLIKIEKHRYDVVDVHRVIQELTLDPSKHPQVISELLDNRITATQIKKIRYLILKADEVFLDVLMTGEYLISSIERQAKYLEKERTGKKIKKRTGGKRKENIYSVPNLKYFGEKKRKNQNETRKKNSKKTKLKAKAERENITLKEAKEISKQNRIKKRLNTFLNKDKDE